MLASCCHHNARPLPRCCRVLLTALLATFLLGVVGTVPAQSPPAVLRSPAATPAAAETEVIPPTPTRYFSDNALMTSPEFADALNLRLGAFEHQTTDQFLVVIFPRMQSSADLGDYCRRVFNAWGVGQKGVNNGVVLFVFVQDHKLWLSVGRGLETPLTNPVCQEIVNQIAAAFKRGDFEGGLTGGVDAVVNILQAQPPPQPTAR